MAKDIEIELKLPLKNGQYVADFLNKNGKFKYENYQDDSYYNPAHRDFLENKDNVNEWLRIRKDGDRALITYKDWQPHETRIKTHAIEYETGIDSYDQLEKIFGALNLKKLIHVKKVRKSWNFKDTEISIDEVEELGSFIEVEYKGNLSDVEQARKYLFKILEEIGAETGELETRGYPYLLLAKKGLL
jgi:predicted adenylyl cyclase CyaB